MFSTKDNSCEISQCISTLKLTMKESNQFGALMPEHRFKDMDIAICQLLFLSPNDKMTTEYKKLFKILKLWSQFNTSFLHTLVDYILSTANSLDGFTAHQAWCISVLAEELHVMQQMQPCHIATLFNNITDSLKYLERSEMNNSDDWKYKLFKLSFQILHYQKETVFVCLKNDDCKIILKDIVLICMGNMPVKNQLLDISNMCGNIIGTMLSYFNSSQNSFTSLHCLLKLNTDAAEIEIMPDLFLPLDVSAVSNNHNALWLIHGVLCCNSSIFDWFYCEGPIHDSKLQSNYCTVLCLMFTKIICACKSDENVQYHGFQTLCLWWSCWLKKLEKFQINLTSCIKELFDENGEFIFSTIQLICDNWDRSAAGVTEKLLQVLGYVSEVNKLINPDGTLITSLCDYLLRMSNAVKGKYGPLSLLIAKFGASLVLDRNPNFLFTLISGLASNHLAPAVSKVHRAVVNNLFTHDSKNFDITLWEEKIGSVLVKSLTSNVRAIHENALHYWVAVSISKNAAVFPKLMELLLIDMKQKHKFVCTSNIFYSDHLCALVGVSQVARCSGYVQFNQLDMEILKQGFMSLNDKTRSNAFYAICKSNKKTEPVSDEEFEIITRNIPLNLNSDAAPFRHDFSLSISFFLSRIQLSVIAAEKQALIDSSAYVKRCVDFITWLNDLCLKCLHSSCSFQRKQTALSLYKVLLSHFVRKSVSKRKPGINDADFAVLLTILKRYDVTLTSPKIVPCILNLFEDVVPEVRDAAFLLLTHYFSYENESDVQNHVRPLYSKLLNSPKSQDTESGALLVEFVQLYSVLKGNYFVNTPGSLHFTTNVISEEEFRDCFYFVKQKLFKIMSQLLAEFKNNVLYSSSQCPPFGWILATSKYLSVLGSLWKNKQFSQLSFVSELWDFLKCVIAECSAIIYFLLEKIFSCTRTTSLSNELVASADFKQMFLKTYGVMRTCNPSIISTDTIIGDGLFAREYESVVSCCWLTLKNACALLSSIGMFILDVEGMDCDHLHFEYFSCLKDICMMFLLVLSMCRHSGVLDSCYVAFMNFCMVLFNAKNALLCKIPIDVVQNLLNILKNMQAPEEGLVGATITRRSAGLPRILDAVLCGGVMSKFACDELLQTSMTSLMQILSQKIDFPLSIDNADLPQVHALYILKSVIQSNVLGPYVASYLTVVFTHAIDCLESSYWSVKNASIHLLSAVLNKMLGQRHIEDKTSSYEANSITTSEFFSRFPSMVNFLDDKLKKSFYLNQCRLKGRNASLAVTCNIGSELHPLISLISHLVHVPESDIASNQHILVNISQALVHLLGCSSYSLRKRVVHSILGWHSTKRITALICGYMGSLLSDEDVAVVDKPEDFIKQNTLHGWLSLSTELFHSHNIQAVDLTELMNLLLHRSWLCNLNYNPCPYTASTYVAAVRSLIKHRLCKPAETQKIANDLLSFIDCGVFGNWIEQALTLQHQQKSIIHVLKVLDVLQRLESPVGFLSYVEEAILLLFYSSSKTTLSVTCTKCFKVGSGVYEMTTQLTCLTWLKDNVINKTEISCICNQVLCSLWQTPKPLARAIENKCLELFVASHLPNSSSCCITLEEYKIISYHLLTLCETYDMFLSVKCNVIKALSVIVAMNILHESPHLDKANFKRHVMNWSSLTQQHTWKTKSSEPLRQASAEALEVVGKEVLMWNHDERASVNGDFSLSELVHITITLCDTAILHLHDEQSDVRNSACIFVSKLPSDYKVIMQHNLATEKLLNFLCSSFKPSYSILNMMLKYYSDVSFPNFAVLNDKTLFVKEDFNLFVEEEYLACLIKPYAEKFISTSNLAEITPVWIKNRLDDCAKNLKQIYMHVSDFTWKKLIKFVVCSLLYTDLILKTIKHLSDHPNVVESLNCIRKLISDIEKVFPPPSVEELLVSIKTFLGM